MYYLSDIEQCNEVGVEREGGSIRKIRLSYRKIDIGVHRVQFWDHSYSFVT